MDPSRNDFNGSGLPPHRRQSQDQGQPQQLSGFPFQFQNHPIALGGIERNRELELRELQDQILLRQELERRQRHLSEHQEIMSQLVEGKYTQLTRQGNENGLHRQQALNLQSSGNRMFMSTESQLRAAVQQQQQQQQHQQQRQSAQAAVQQALLQKHLETQHQRELQQQQEFREIQNRQFLQDELDNQQLREMLSRMDGIVTAPNGNIDNDTQNQIMDTQVKNKRKRSISTGSGGMSKLTSGKTKGSKKKRGESKGKSKQKKQFINGIDGGTHEKPLEIVETAESSIDEHLQYSMKENEQVDQGLNDHAASGKTVGEETDMENVPQKNNVFQNEVAKSDSLEALIQAAKKSDAEKPTTEDNKPETIQEEIDESNPPIEGDNGMEMLLAAANPANPPTMNEGFTDEEAVNIIQHLKETTALDPTAAAYFGMLDLEQVEISPGYFASVPKLPEEPEFDEAEAERLAKENSTANGDQEESAELKKPEEVRRDVTVPTFLDTAKKDTKPIHDHQTVDDWFPSSTQIRRERRANGLTNDDREVQLGNSKNDPVLISDEMNKKMKNEIEPGVLEKLPHCKVHHQAFLHQYGRYPKYPLFCCQTTEAHCSSTMVCCSICSTWRHAECGGHYTHYSPNSTDEFFTPICDRCHKETVVMKHYPLAVKRIARQRAIQLRTVHAVTAIMRNSAYAKHGGTYKWPLGSVSPFLIYGHTKSIQLRHERSEKHWKDMAAKLNANSSSKGSRAKTRTRDFERLMVNLEDAEGQTDRHNMTLFLEWDTSCDRPVGFEKPCLNFFDPDEDDQTEQCFSFEGVGDDVDYDIIDDDNTQKDGTTQDKKGLPNGEKDGNIPDKTLSSSSSTGADLMICTSTSAHTSAAETAVAFAVAKRVNATYTHTPTNDDSRGGRIIARSSKVRQSPKKINKLHCIRPNCKKKPRFDSSFCSDACGIWTMEKDLLCSLQYANEMHPYQLRP